MAASATAAAARRKRSRAAAAAPSHANAPHLAPLPAPPQQSGVGLPFPISIAGGEWPVDWARAQRDAQDALNAIDFSKKDIVIWVPGTGDHKIDERFEAAVRASWKDGGVSLSRIEYEASWNMRPSTATGVATLRLVLAGIAAHGGDHNVMLAGQSQGAWVLGEALADPMLRKVVKRAVLLGHPALAAHHYSDGRDPGILEINHKGDYVAAPVKGDATKALDAFAGLRRGDLTKLPAVIAHFLSDPAKGAMALQDALSYVIPFIVNPHDYGPDSTAVVEFLRTGNTGYGVQTAPAGTVTAAAAVLPRLAYASS